MTTDPPTFDRPPVLETAIGAQFDPLAKFSNAHLGAFWASLGDQWSSLSDAPPLPQQFERFGTDQAWARLGGLQVRVGKDVASRIRVSNASGTRLIQVQNGRFSYNWLGASGETYPRYRTIRDEFDHYFETFRRFVTDRALGDVQLNQWEVL